MAGSKAPLTPKQQALHDLALARTALGPQWQSATAVMRPAALIQSSIRRLGFQPKDVKILLNTHAHFDLT